MSVLVTLEQISKKYLTLEQAEQCDCIVFDNVAKYEAEYSPSLKIMLLKSGFQYFSTEQKIKRRRIIWRFVKEVFFERKSRQPR